MRGNSHVRFGSGGRKSDLPADHNRLVWFRAVYPNGSIETEMLHLDLEHEVEAVSDTWNDKTQQSEKVVKRSKGLAIFKATVKDGAGGIGTGTKSETAANFPDFIEAAETGAIGRALASLGFGTQFAPELQEQHRIVDSPVSRSHAATGNGYRSAPATARVAEKPASTYRPAERDETPQSITESQVASLHRLYERLGKAEPENLQAMDYLGARELIAQLSQEYRQSRSKAS
jgi:hypothetical protein